MPKSCLQEFVSELEKRGELLRIKEPISKNLEISWFTQVVSKKKGPALLFESHKPPVLTNAFGSMERIRIALDIKNIDDVKEKFTNFLARPDKYQPQSIHASAPCQEWVQEGEAVDIKYLPILKAWPGDGGPSITLPVVITKNPLTGTINSGIYRLQLFDKKTTGIHWRKGSGGFKHLEIAEKMGKRLEVAVAIGPPPPVTFAASAPLPTEMDELSFAGYFLERPLEMTRCRTVDMDVPASSQVILEGYVEPEEKRREGPFGNHTGYYDPWGDYPVFHITCVTMRKDAIYPATIVGPPPQEDCYIAKASEPIILKILQESLPEIIDINLPIEGIFKNLAIVSLDKKYPGHGKDVLKSLRKRGLLSKYKIISLFDKNVDIRDFSRVIWKTVNNLEPEVDLIVSKGKGNASHIDLDCTKKLWFEKLTMTDGEGAAVRKTHHDRQSVTLSLSMEEMTMPKEIIDKMGKILQKIGEFDGR